MFRQITCLSLLFLIVAATSLSAAEVLFPQERQAYYTHEAIELAVAGLADGAKAAVEIVPTQAGLAPLKIGRAHV